MISMDSKHGGLGDFVMLHCERPIANWSEVAGQLAWPSIGGSSPQVNYRHTGSVYAAWQGDVGVRESADSLQLELGVWSEQSSSEDFLKNPQSGFFGKYVRAEALASGQLIGVTDPARQYPLYYYCLNGVKVLATDLRLIAGLPVTDSATSLQAVYHHLNFSYIPTPFTIYRHMYKVPAANQVKIGKTADLESYWDASYPESNTADEQRLQQELHEQIVSTVSAYRNKSGSTATFLSGGTDSSTITGVMSEAAGKESTSAYSIGFEEEGFDELEYAKIAADAFGVDHHTQRVGADEGFSAIEKLLGAYDEPFGNSSSVPTLYCSSMAYNNGHRLMVAGDGGDEIFGGNERYAKDYWFQRYYSMPGVVKGFGSVVRKAVAPIDQRFINRVGNFLYRGSLPNPERFYTDDSFASEFYDELLTDGFRAECQRSSSLDILHHWYDRCDSRTELNRLMYIDLKMAISDNDLTKVNRAAKTAGINVLYPYLSPGLVQFMGTVPANYKVHGTEKRYLFKKAVETILPEAIRKKKKQGFGLPVGEWFRTEKRFRELASDTLLSTTAMERGYFNQPFIEKLLERHDKRVWDYSQEIWLLLMLELWHHQNVDSPSAANKAA